MPLSELILLAGRVILVVTGTFLVITLITSIMRFHLLTQRIQLSAKDNANLSDLFQLRMVQQLGALHQAPVPFAVLLITPDATPASNEKPDGEDTALSKLESWIRPRVRSSDFIARFEQRHIGVLISSVNEADTLKVAQRLLTEATGRTAPRGAAPYPSLSIGISTFPASAQHVAGLLDTARHALEGAQRAGGGRMEYQASPAAPDETETAKAEGTNPILDEDTGLLKAKRLKRAIQKFMAFYRRKGSEVSIIYLSIDSFKQYHEHYSDQATRAILRGLANVLKQYTRPSDLLARADESDFLVMLDARPEDAFVVAQRMAAEIKRTPLQTEHTQLRCTASSGVAGSPDHGRQAEQLFEHARTAMHTARERGQNMCLMYLPEMTPNAQGSDPVDSF